MRGREPRALPRPAVFDHWDEPIRAHLLELFNRGLLAGRLPRDLKSANIAKSRYSLGYCPYLVTLRDSSEIDLAPVVPSYGTHKWRQKLDEPIMCINIGPSYSLSIAAITASLQIEGE